MNKEERGTIAVDLDGTLAKHNGWKGPGFIGEPIPLMLARVLKWLKEGRKVVIFTARVSSDNPNREISLSAIKEWCKKYLGQELEVTAEKRMEFVTMWDDRAKQVVPNTGLAIDGDN